MASWMIHLRIADELLLCLDGIDETAFVMGNIAPDSGVPNSSWTEFHPPKMVTHFYKKTESGRAIDLDSFCRQYFSESLIRGYSLREHSFFLGYLWLNVVVHIAKETVCLIEQRVLSAA